MAETQNEMRADRQREKRQSTKKLVMGALLAVLVAAGAYILISGGSKDQEVAQTEIQSPTFAPSSLQPPIALPPVPLPDATPMPATTAPTPNP